MSIKYYCKHVAPGGLQDMNCFNKLLKTGFSAISWNLPDIYIIDKIKNDSRFFNKMKNTFNIKISLKELIQFIKENLSEEAIQYLIENYRAKDINDKKIKHFSSRAIGQFWIDVSMPVNSILFIRGKKDLPEGYIVKCITNNIQYVPYPLFYDSKHNNYIMIKKYKIIKKMTDDSFRKFIQTPASIYQIKKKENISIINKELNDL